MSFLDFLHPIWKRDIEGYQYSDNLNKSVLSAIENSLSQAESDVIQSKTDSYLAQATGVALDLWGQWFGIYRQDAEPDTAFRSRILYNITVTRGTISAIIQGLENYFNDYTGDIQVYEPYKNIFYTNKSFLNGDDHFAGDIYNYAVIDVQFSRNFPPDIIDIINLYKPAGVKVLLHYIPNKYSPVSPINILTPSYTDARQFLQLENGTESLITGHLQLGDSLSSASSGLFTTNVSYLNGADVLTGDFSINRPTFNYASFMPSYMYTPLNADTISTISTENESVGGGTSNNDIYILTMSDSANEAKFSISPLNGTNLLVNSDFESWASGVHPNNWGKQSAVTLTQVAGYNSSSAVRYTATTSGYNTTDSFYSLTALSANTQYALSGMVKRVNGTGPLGLGISGTGTFNLTSDVSGNWVPFSLIFTTTSSSNGSQLNFYVGTAGDTFDIDRVKLEVGNKVTDWSPAPSDPNASINNTNLYLFLDMKAYMSNFYTDYMNINFPGGTETNQDLAGFLTYVKLFLYFHGYLNGGSVPYQLNWFNFTDNAWESMQSGTMTQTMTQAEIDLNKIVQTNQKTLSQFINQNGVIALSLTVPKLSFTYNLGISYFDLSFKKNLGPASVYQMTSLACL